MLEFACVAISYYKAKKRHYISLCSLWWAVNTCWCRLDIVDPQDGEYTKLRVLDCGYAE